MSNCLTRVDKPADKTEDHMSRLFVTATVLFVAAGSWSVTAQPPATAGARPVASSVVPRVAGARSDVLTFIQGKVLDSANEPMPGALVRLRDARVGRVIETRLTDESGVFAFKVADPGSYIVELLGRDRTPLATSQILTVNAGDTVSAIVKLPSRATPFAGLLSSSIAPAAAMVVTQAVATGIVAVVPTAPVSPNR
jgi:Carboxypeptidase regulatory-like domain